LRQLLYWIKTNLLYRIETDPAKAVPALFYKGQYAGYPTDDKPGCSIM